MVQGLLLASLCVIWGATWVAIKIGLADSPPFYGAAVRFILATAVLGIIVAARKLPWPKEPTVWRWTILSGILMYFGSYSVVYFVEQYINASLASILFASFPFFVAIGAHYHLPHERLSTLKLAGLVVGFAGVIVLFSGGAAAPSTTAWWAPGLMLVSPFVSAVSNIIVKKHLTGEDPFVLNVIQMAIGVACLLPLAFLFEDLSDFRWTAKSIGAVIFLGSFGSVFAFVTLYHLMKSMAASRLSLIAFATPITAVILGWVVLGEQLTWATAAGTVLVLAGIYIVSILAKHDGAVPVDAAAVEAADRPK